MVEPLEEVSEREQSLVEGKHDIGVDAARSRGWSKIRSESANRILILKTILELTLLAQELVTTPSSRPARWKPGTPRHLPHQTCPPI